MLDSSSLSFKKTVNYQAVLQLSEFWLARAKEDQNQLITKETLFKLANIDRKVALSQQLATEAFFLLITPNFNAFLHSKKIVTTQEYQVTITFDSTTIIQELIQLGYRYKWEATVIEYLQTDLATKLSSSRDRSVEFMTKAVKLLIDDQEKPENHHKLNHIPPMDELLQYQVEQERILARIKIQIGQNLDLSKIIQTAIDYSQSFLELDRLLVYQLDVPLTSNHLHQPVRTIDTVTYEAKTERVNSTLYFQEEICWRKTSECENKYHQGFGLVINDVEVGSNLNPCLRFLMQKFQVKAKAVTPINVRGKLWGLLIAHQCFESRQWHHQEIQFLRQIADYLAIAIYHHQSYQQLQQQKKLLEKQVQTQAQQIKDALIAAEAASRSKHEFLGSMSHELRTPLTCVIGLSSTLLQWSSRKAKVSLSPEKQHEYLYLIQQSGKHLLSLINNILEFSDLESGKHLLNIEQISLTDVAKHCLQMLQETAKTKGIILSSEINLGGVEQEYLVADEIRLKEILYNLLSNGIKFTPEGGKVTLRVWREKRYAVLQVEDTGIGIAPEEIPLLFEKFKQIENFRQRTQGGTGIGLALTKKLIELHGGNIEVESALGQGSVFTVYLPVKIPLQPHLEQESVAPQTSATASTIMLVTEDEESAIFICQLLNTIECQVVWLMDAVMAMNQIDLLQPELVIIDRDCFSTEVNDTVRGIKNTASTNSVDLILLSDRLSHQQWQEFAQNGVDDYLTKSMNPTQMIDKINRLLRERNQT